MTAAEPLSDEPGGPTRWRQIADRIIARIASGDLKPGQPVPSTTELCDRHGVAPATARQAITWLASQGHITVHQGRRSVVAELRPAAPHPFQPQPGNALKCETCGGKKGQHR